VEGVDRFRLLCTKTELERPGGVRLRDPKRTGAAGDTEPGPAPSRQSSINAKPSGRRGAFVEALARLVVRTGTITWSIAILDRIVRSYESCQMSNGHSPTEKARMERTC
jgi:hypothetical protein